MSKQKIITLVLLDKAIQELVIELEKEFPEERVDHAGIKPIEKPTDFNRYESTPINTTLFAWIGGDGVHFSLLEISDAIQPVVMTVPARLGNSIADYNWILGENLNEFLSLGYYNGWFGLENICYNMESTLKLYQQKTPSKDYYFEIDRRFVRRLSERLSYKHTPLSIKRLEFLKENYFDKLIFKESFVRRLSEKK